MDSRGGPTLRLTNPVGALARLEQRGGEFPALIEARRYTAAKLQERRAQLSGVDCPPDVAVVLFGSWAREELTGESDDDWAVVVEAGSTDRDDVRAVVDATRRVLGVQGRRPGAQDLFGVAFGCDELVQQVGLEEDSNRRLTRRVLLLLESTPLLGVGAHQRSWDSVLQTYLSHGAKSYRPPRFLLNDLVRYWRTMCVDFEGKHWSGVPDEKWVIRNAKLRTSRKVLFAGGLVPLLGANAVSQAEMGAFLRQQFQAPPVDRLAEAFLQLDDGQIAEAGIRGLQAYDRFVGLMADEAFRKHLRSLDADTRKGARSWMEIRSIGDELQQSLLALLFGPTLAPLTKQFAIF